MINRNMNNIIPLYGDGEGAGKAIYQGSGSPDVNNNQNVIQSSDWLTQLWNDYGLYLTIAAALLAGYLIFFKKK